MHRSGSRQLRLPMTSDVTGRKILPGDVAADVNPLNSPARGKFEPAHVGCYNEIEGVRRARAFAFRQRANVAQAFGHDAAGMGKISMPIPHTQNFKRTVDDSPFRESPSGLTSL